MMCTAVLRTLALFVAIYGAAANNHHNSNKAVHTSSPRTKTVQVCVNDFAFNARQPEIAGDNLGLASFNAAVVDCASRTVSPKSHPNMRREVNKVSYLKY